METTVTCDDCDFQVQAPWKWAQAFGAVHARTTNHMTHLYAA